MPASSSPSPISALPSALPMQPFFTLPGQRVALARERFFDSGERPSGLVSEAVIQSWTRCLAARHSPRHAVAFEPVTRGRMHAALERNRALLLAAGDDIQRLEAALAGTASRVLLTDANGVIVHATPAAVGATEQVLRRVARLGVNLAEDEVGTNAPAVVVKTGQAVTVLGAEHYYDCVQTLHCAAAPIRDGRGRLAGVLDLTIESRPFAFDAAALVAVYALMIENRLLQAMAGGHLLLQFQVCSSMLGSPLQALVGIADNGRLAWHNGTAQKLLGLGSTGPRDVAALFGASLAELQAYSSNAAAAPLRLPNGLTVWLRASMGAERARRVAVQAAPELSLRSGLAAAAASAAAATAAALPAAVATPASPAAAAAPAPPAPSSPPATATLDQATSDVIERTLAECRGNISRAARRLGVSRGLLYRHLRALPSSPPKPTA